MPGIAAMSCRLWSMPGMSGIGAAAGGASCWCCADTGAANASAHAAANLRSEIEHLE